MANIRLMYEGLTSLDENLQTVPGAAESWVYNADATELTFTLRGGLQYSDGTPLNAKRFAYSILRNIDPTTNGEYAGITDEISGAWAYRNADVGNLTPEQLQQLRDAVEVRALDTGGQPCASYAQLDCRTLRLRFERPASYFHTVMSMWVTFPAKEELIAAGGAEWWRSPQHQIGNGPFVMTANTADTLTRYTPNTRYWRGLATYGIEYRYMADSAEAFAAYRADQLDIIAPGPSERGAIEGDPVLKQQLLAYPGSCTIVIKMSLAAKYTDPAGHEYNTPFMDKKVREAFAYAFDAEGWAKDVDQGRSTPTWTWIPPGFPGYDATTPLKFDPDLARQKLAESSYGGPANLNALGLKLTYGDTELNRVRSEWLVANYKKHLDVDIALDPVDTVTYSNLARNPATFPLLARQGWCADYPDPQNWLSVYWRSDSAFAQRQGYTNDLFDQLTAQADASPDQAARMALYKQAQQVLLVDVPAAFGYNSANVYLVKPRVQGIKTTPQDSDWAGSMVPLNITLR
jgi:oligopeptide transport system substrate-binding protein